MKKRSGTRVNWDEEPHFSLRKRVADAWINKEDLYVTGDSLYSFCERTTVSRAVLTRYLPRRRKEIEDGITIPAGKRGRPAHLSESVQRHVCEGSNCIVYIKINEPLCVNIKNIMLFCSG